MAQAGGRGRVAVALDRKGKIAPERFVRSEEAGVQEIEDGLQLGESVLDGSARESGTPVRLVPDGKIVQTVQRDGRLEFDSEVRLHSIYEIA